MMCDRNNSDDRKGPAAIISPARRHPPAPARDGRTRPQPLLEEPDGFIGSVAAGRFRVMGIIGEGGMGRVYSALDEGTGMMTAIKVASDSASTPLEKSAAFLAREIRAMSMLRHENIVGYVGHGVHLGRPFLALEYVDGETLRERTLFRGTLQPGPCRSIFMQMCDALGAAHQEGVVHGDIKPGNIFLASGARDETLVKLFDFGLVKFMLEGGDPGRVQEPGVITGTVAYLAPEQLKEMDFDHRADIYAMGVTMYQTLSGALPFAGLTDWTILNSKIGGRAVPLGKRCPGMFPGMEGVVMRALERNPDDRFQSAADMKNALSGIAL